MTATATPIADVPGATTGWVRGRLIGDAPIIAPLRVPIPPMSSISSPSTVNPNPAISGLTMGL